MSPTDDELDLLRAADDPLDATSQREADAADARARWQGEALRPDEPPAAPGAPVAPRVPPRSPSAASRESPRSWLPGLIILLAALGGGGARAATADWGLPYALHIDEKGFVLHEALWAEYRGLTRGDFRPRNTAYGPLVFELVIATKWALFGGREAAERLASGYTNEWEYAAGVLATQTTPTTISQPDLLYALRLLSAVLGALTIGLLGLAAARLETPRVGAIAAILAAASVGLFQVGHFYTAESILVFALALFLHACAKLATGPARFWPVVQAGVALALIAASKGPGLVAALALPAALAHQRFAAWGPGAALRSLGATLRACFSAPMLLALAFALLAYAPLNPWLVSADPGEYFRDIAPNRSGAALLRIQFTEREFSFYDWRFVYNDALPFWTHLRTLLPYALGGPVCVAAYLGLLRGLGRRSALDKLAFWGAVPPLLLVGAFSVMTVRYVLPAVPALILAAASVLAHAPEWSAKRRERFVLPRALRAAFYAVVAAVLVFTCARGVAYALMFRAPDPRVLAGRYLVEHAAPGDVILLEPEGSYSAVLNDDYDAVGRVDDEDPRFAAGRWAGGGVSGALRDVRVLRLFRGRPEGEHLTTTLGGQLVRARYVVVGDWYHRRARHPSAAARAPIQHAFYRELFGGELGFEVAAAFPRSPRFPDVDWGYVWDEHDEEALSVCFDHMPVTIFERALAPGLEAHDPAPGSE